jgi:signal transduction histidine kinase
MSTPLIAPCDRARVASALHDLVAHQVSIVNIQAGAAHSLILESPADALEALAVVRRTAQEALDDVHRLQVVLSA